MVEFTESMGFVVFFLIGTLLIAVFFGEEVTFWYLLLVLLGMVYANTDKIQELAGRFSK